MAAVKVPFNSDRSILRQDRRGDTHVGDAEQGYEEGGDDDEEREELPVLVEALKLIDQPGDHRLHASHLRTECMKTKTAARPSTTMYMLGFGHELDKVVMIEEIHPRLHFTIALQLLTVF